MFLILISIPQDPVKGLSSSILCAGLPRWLRLWRICLHCRRPRFDPCVGQIPLEKGMATQSHILAWRIPWTVAPWAPQSLESQRVGQDWATNTLTFFLILYAGPQEGTIIEHILDTEHCFNHFICIDIFTISGGRYYHYRPHFTDKEFEAQRDKMPHSRPHSCLGVETGSSQGSPGFSPREFADPSCTLHLVAWLWPLGSASPSACRACSWESCLHF